jgi:hypothetical protein
MAHVHAAACFGRKGAGLWLQVYHVGNYRPSTTILTVPHLLQGRELCLHVDNIAAVFGWENRWVAKDQTASVFVRALHLISTYLGCRVHVLHLPRMSTPDARLADRLSRKHTTTAWDRCRIRGAIKTRDSAIPSATDGASLC